MIAPEQQEDEEAKYPERELGEEEAKEDEGEAECASEPVMPLPAHKPPRDVPAVELPSGKQVEHRHEKHHPSCECERVNSHASWHMAECKEL